MSTRKQRPRPEPFVVHHPSSPLFQAQLTDAHDDLRQRARLWLLAAMAADFVAMETSSYALQVLGIRECNGQYETEKWTPEATLKEQMAYDTVANTWRQRIHDAVEHLRMHDRDIVDQTRDAFQAELEAKFDEDAFILGSYFIYGDGWPAPAKLPPDVAARRPRIPLLIRVKSRENVEREDARFKKYTALYRKKIALVEPEQAALADAAAIESHAVLLTSLLDDTTQYTLANLPYPYRLTDKMTFTIGI